MVDEDGVVWEVVVGGVGEGVMGVKRVWVEGKGVF